MVKHQAPTGSVGRWGRPGTGALVLAGILLVLIAVPTAADSSILLRLSRLLILALFAASVNLVMGYTGLITFGHAAFFAIGGYTVGMLLREQASLAVGFVAAVILSAVAAAIIGYLCLRAKGIAFAILTLTFGQMVYMVIYQSPATGGQNGLSGFKAPLVTLAGLSTNLDDPLTYYYFILLIVCIALALLWMLTISRFGQTIVAIREDEIRASFLGVNVRSYKLLAFVLSGAFSAVAGALFAPLQGVMTADYASWTFSSVPILMILLGGMFSFWGPLVGAGIFELFEYGTRGMAGISDVVIGALLLIVVMALPGGVWEARTSLQKFKGLLGRKRVSARDGSPHS